MAKQPLSSRIREYQVKNPDASAKQIAAKFKTTQGYVYAILNADKKNGWKTVSLSTSDKPTSLSQTITMVEDDTYELLLDDNPPRIVTPALELWPITYAGQRGAVEIDFIAGYGAAGNTVPPMLKQAIKMLVAHWYEHREAVGTVGQEVPLAVDSILRLYQDGGYN